MRDEDSAAPIDSFEAGVGRRRGEKEARVAAIRGKLQISNCKLQIDWRSGTRRAWRRFDVNLAVVPG
jgi:hypothetical protein